MGRDYLVIGSSPSGEACAQVGQWDYSERSRIELRAFVAQLRRVFGPEPAGCRLGVMGFSHEFGRYHEVVCHFDEDNAAAVAYAYRCEAECPEVWDADARREVAAYLPVEDD